MATNKFSNDLANKNIDVNELTSNNRFNSQTFQILLLIFLTAFIYLGSAWAPALLDDADAAHAEAAKEMVERGDYITLHINGIRYLEKAPLMYWTVAISYKIFGFTEFATRLPLAIATLLLVVAIYFFGKWMAGSRAGFYSALTVSVGLGFYLFTRILIPEIILSLFITVSLYYFLKAYYGDVSKNYYYIFYVGMAAAVLTKGLIGIVFPLGTLFLFILATNGWKKLREMRIISGLIIFFIIATPWHILAGLNNENPNGHGFFWLYFINEHFLRYLGKRYPVDYDKVPLLSFWFMHFVWLFPFSLFLPIALRRLKTLIRPVERQEQLRLFLFIWIFVVVGFFSFSTRQEYYTYPAFPAFALLSGLALANGEKDKDKLVMIGQIILAVLGNIVAIILAALLWISRNVKPVEDISTLLSNNPENYKLALGHASDLTTEAFAVLRFPAAGAAIVFAIGFSLALFFRYRGKALNASLVTALTVGGFIYFAHNALGIFEPYLSSHSLAVKIKQQLAPGDLVVLNGEYQGGSSIGFYLPQKLLLLNGRMTGLEFGSHYPDAPPIFINNNDITNLWQADKRIFLFTYDDKFDQVKSLLPGNIYTFATSGGKTIYSNRP